MKFVPLLIVSLLSLSIPWSPSAIAQMPNSTHDFADVRIIFLPSQTATSQSHPSIISFHDNKSGKDITALFQHDNDGGLEGERYIARRIHFGIYEVHVAIAENKTEISRIVKIDARSESIYFSRDTATAHIMLVDPMGDPERSVIDKVVDNFGTDYAKAFDKSSTAPVPYGTYEVQAHAKGFGMAITEVCFCRPDAWAVLGLDLPIGDTIYPYPTVRLKGSIKVDGPIKAPIIVRLSPAYIT